MDNRDNIKAFGEWLCAIAPNSLVKSLMRDSMRAMYERDYVIVTNLCNGFGEMPSISIKTIDGAKERYKEFNKSVLEISPLSEEDKKGVSAQIDLNAENLKQRWIHILRQRGICVRNY